MVVGERLCVVRLDRCLPINRRKTPFSGLELLQMLKNLLRTIGFVRSEGAQFRVRNPDHCRQPLPQRVRTVHSSSNTCLNSESGILKHETLGSLSGLFRRTRVSRANITAQLFGSSEEDVWLGLPPSRGDFWRVGSQDASGMEMGEEFWEVALGPSGETMFLHEPSSSQSCAC